MSEVTLTREQRETLSKRKLQMEVSLLEQELLFQLRTIAHGKLTVQMIDSIPTRYEINVSKFFEGGKDFDIFRKNTERR